MMFPIYTKPLILIILLMSGPRTRLTVLTNTNVRFLTSLPSSSSLRKALPLLLSTYRAVVSENLGNDHELLEG